ncbi:hypothetical protein D3C81_2218500 [compost metagenome]
MHRQAVVFVEHVIDSLNDVDKKTCRGSLINTGKKQSDGIRFFHDQAFGAKIGNIIQLGGDFFDSFPGILLDEGVSV